MRKTMHTGNGKPSGLACRIFTVAYAVYEYLSKGVEHE